MAEPGSPWSLCPLAVPGQDGPPQPGAFRRLSVVRTGYTPRDSREVSVGCRVQGGTGRAPWLPHGQATSLSWSVLSPRDLVLNSLSAVPGPKLSHGSCSCRSPWRPCSSPSSHQGSLRVCSCTSPQPSGTSWPFLAPGCTCWQQQIHPGTGGKQRALGTAGQHRGSAGVSAHGMWAPGEFVPRPSEHAAPPALHEQRVELWHQCVKSSWTPHTHTQKNFPIASRAG